MTAQTSSKFIMFFSLVAIVLLAQFKPIVYLFHSEENIQTYKVFSEWKSAHKEEYDKIVLEKIVNPKEEKKNATLAERFKDTEKEADENVTKTTYSHFEIVEIEDEIEDYYKKKAFNAKLVTYSAYVLIFGIFLWFVSRNR